MIHLTLVPYLSATGELKTKPTQHSVKQLLENGVQPDVLVLRTEHHIDDAIRAKVALFTNVSMDAVVQSVDVPTIYEVPLKMLEEKLDVTVLRKLDLPVEEVEARVGNVLTILGINDLRYANPKNLSGGQKQLVALGAVLSLDPGILVLDEVMAPLDPASKKRISDAVNALRQRGKTVLVVEHDLEAVSFADRILVLENGRLIKDGQAPDVLGEREFLLRHKLELEDELRIKRWDL